ncbi:RHS repeat-associated core domain-containing protein [Sorangium sp. So ce296]|uniref:RHS repeat-associated core domain-containing protein n=1 Tax=Sorangium sp. So ce296 TaxID=3133296 RepID=UPI003F62E6A1
MARTAPFPNAAVIPGMNPGVFILGGGGAGGGGSGRGGNGRGDGQGGGGKNGGNGARGGGKDAGSCGPGSGGGCPNPTHGGGGTHAGDPVDPITGRVYTVAVVDLALPGTIPLVLKRSYSSARIDEDGDLGFGWTHSLSWQVEEGRRGLRVLEPHAAATELPRRLEPGASARLPCGVLTRYAWGYALAADGLAYLFAEPQGSRWLLSRIVDLHDNLIELTYENGRLVQVIDSVGRIVRVRRHKDGHIAAFDVKNASAHGRWEARRRYAFDARGDLVAAEDAARHAQRFTYDEDHRLVRREEPGGLVAEFRYKDGRCVESWCHRHGNDALDDGAPETLFDGSRARVFLHVKIDHHDGALTEVITSRSIRRIDGNAFGKLDRMVWGGGSGVHTFRYDDAGALLEYQDATQRVFRWERDAEGRLVAEVDPMGNRTHYEHDARGFVSAITDALGGAARYERDARGDVVAVYDDAGFVVGFAYDSRGLLVGATLPNGGETRMAVDALANRVRVVEPDGSERRIRYDFLGRVTGFTDERGHETRFAYDACGRLCAVFGPGSAVTRYGFDADGNLAQITDADGRTTTLRWGGFHVVTELVRPDGSKVRYRYDREQDLVRIVNEAGEEHRIQRDGEGRITGERTFDGREIRYRLDAQGRIERVDRGSDKVDFEYDPLGRLVKRTTSDGREDVFDYDPLGRIERAASGDVECLYTYDRRGRVLTEVTRRGAEVLAAFAWTYDAMGRVTGVRGSGSEMSVQRDVMGRPVAAQIGGESAPLRFAYDAGGHEVARVLPGGGTIATDIDAEGLVQRQRVLGRPSAPRVELGEPPWVGPLMTPETWRRTYAWSPAGMLRADEDLGGTARAMLRDANGRVIERRRAGQPTERFRYSATGAADRDGERRTYAPGGRLTERATARQAVRYEHSERGDVVRKRVNELRVEGGGEQAPERVWTYAWSADGRLMEARTADANVISFAYDAFGRRIEKRVAQPGKVASVTRYAWRGDVLVHERTERAREDGESTAVEERSYVTLPESALPLAQRDGAAGTLRYFVHGVNGFPQALVEGDGRVAAEIEAGLYGDVPGGQAGITPLRFPGQYADAETGLHYNWHRYYDPEAGVYLSPEPIGIEGGLRSYAYVDNYPVEWVDADGLARMECTITRTDGSTLTGVSRGRPRSDLHPAVQAALPPSNARGQDANVQPQNCAEPQALSDHLEDWQNRTGLSCRPGDPGWRRNLRAAMGEIDPNGGIASSMGGTPRASCPNCSQTIPRLYALAGMAPPNRVIAPGHQDQERSGPQTRTTRPAGGFLSNPANRAASSFSDSQNRGGIPGNVPGRGGLGTWTYDEERGFWHRH